MATKTRAPKDQIERYTNDGVTKFKSDDLAAEIPWHFKDKIQVVDLKSLTPSESKGEGGSGQTTKRYADGYENFKEWSRGKASEVR